MDISNDATPSSNEDLFKKEAEPSVEDGSSSENNQIVDLNEEFTKAITEFSFGTFWNWFLPSAIDVWSSSSSSSNSSNVEPETVIAYGAKSFLFLADVYSKSGKNRKPKQKCSGTILTENNSTATDGREQQQPKRMNREWKIRYRDIVNVFDIKPKSSFFDAFRSSNSYITTVVFDKTFSIIKHGSNSNQRVQSTNCAMLFLGNSDGVAALYDCHRRITLLQNLPFSSISRPCCRSVTQKKILTAAWLHFQTEGPVVYYSLDTHIVVWKVKKNKVKIFHDQKQDCSDSRFNSSHVQIACLASLPAECTTDKNEHRLAIGYMGGKVAIIGLDPITGRQTSLTMFTENCHNDDICSLCFSSYSQTTHPSYRNGLLCSLSRDSVLKIWSCSNQCEIAEHRIITGQTNSAKHGSNSSGTNWFAAAFLPRANKSPNVAFEIVLTNSGGDLLTFTLPEKGTNSKLRIGKTQKTFHPKVRKNELVQHSFIIFSIAINLEQQMAITISLDFKLILWDLVTRISGDVFYSFSNGAFAIDSCLADKRVAVAFGSNIFILDFVSNSNPIEDERFGQYDVLVHRLALSGKKSKFYNVIWNKKYFERLGRVIIGTSNGELYQYDLNSKSIVFKSNKSQDVTKIYSIIWLDSLLHPCEEETKALNIDGDHGDQMDDDQKPLAQQQQQQQPIENGPVVLTLHQSGKIMVNYMVNNLKQENFEKYLAGLVEDPKIKRTAATISTDGRYLIMGNDDGAVDVFAKITTKQEQRKYPAKAFKHLYRFRAFNRPCLSIEYCSNTKWLAVTSMHEKHINCYHLDDLGQNDNFEENEESEGKPETELDRIQVKTIATKCRLSGHEDRVSFTCWSPFNQVDGGLVDQEEDDGKKILLASASYDTTCIIWNVSQKQALKRFYGHKSVVYTIRWCHFNPDHIFSGGEDNFFFWNWTIQPDYSPSLKIADKHVVKINSLKSILNKNQDENVDANDHQNGPSAEDGKVPAKTADTNEIANDFDVTISSLVSEISKLTSKTSATSSGSNSGSAKVKALFPVSNQIENSSSKYDILDDIKWLIRLKKGNENVENEIPATKLDRILLYGDSNHIERMLRLEIENHRNNRNLEGQYMLSLFLNTRDCIEKSIEQNECDPVLAMFAAGLSGKLYTSCVENILGVCAPNRSPSISSKIKWNNHWKELSALMRLHCLNDFQGAIDSLLLNNLYREAIIMSTVNLASEDYVSDLLFQWHQFRLKQRDNEGAIKCLVASKHYSEAIELLDQHRTLCSGVSSGSILKQYDEIIEILKN